MCLILFAWQAHARYPLVVAANRDEFYARPAARLAEWSDQPGLYAGRDLQAGGTWLGMTRDGRFAALTNYRDPQRVRTERPSRGALVSDFLRAQLRPAEYCAELAVRAGDYNGFNLLVGDRDELWCFSNFGDGAMPVKPGIHGLSNHLLDTPWPKVQRGRARFTELLAADEPDERALFALLGERRVAADAELPATGVSLEWERALSPLFITMPEYGTRCSTVLLRDRGGDSRLIELDARSGDEVRLELSAV